MDKFEVHCSRNNHDAHHGGSRDDRHGHGPPDEGSGNEHSLMHGLHMQRT